MTERTECIICEKVLDKSHAFKSILARDEHSFSYTACSECMTLNINQVLVPSELNGYYNSNYYGKGDKKFKNYLINSLLYITKKKKTGGITKSLSIGNNILDIGCGDGSFLMELNNSFNGHSLNLFGTELQGNSANRVSQLNEVSLFIGTFMDSKFKSNFFDLITLIHVYEHLPNPINNLIEIKRIIKDEGYIYIAIPNVNSFQYKIFRQNWFHLDPPIHIFFQTRESILQVLTNLNLNPVLIKEKHLNLEYNIYGWQQSILNYLHRSKKKKNLLYEYFKGSKKLSSLIFIHLLFTVLTLPIAILLTLLSALLKKGATVEYLIKTSKERSYSNS